MHKVPEVNPNQLFACGHSSAAIQALDLAANDRRIRACCAYAPCTSCAQAWHESKLNQLLPGFSEFAEQFSPLSHVDDFTCPVFLFHAEDDSNVPFTEGKAGFELMQKSGVNATFSKVPTGDHYDSMIEQGIPAAIGWLKTIDKPAAGK